MWAVESRPIKERLIYNQYKWWIWQPSMNAYVWSGLAGTFSMNKACSHWSTLFTGAGRRADVALGRGPRAESSAIYSVYWQSPAHWLSHGQRTARAESELLHHRNSPYCLHPSCDVFLSSPCLSALDHWGRGWNRAELVLRDETGEGKKRRERERTCPSLFIFLTSQWNRRGWVLGWYHSKNCHGQVLACWSSSLVPSAGCWPLSLWTDTRCQELGLSKWVPISFQRLASPMTMTDLLLCMTQALVWQSASPRDGTMFAKNDGDAEFCGIDENSLLYGTLGRLVRDWEDWESQQPCIKLTPLNKMKKPARESQTC